MEPSSHLAQKFFHLSMHCLPYSGTNSRHTHHTPTNPKMAYGRHLTRLKLIHSKLNYIGACPYALQVQDPNFISFVVFLLLLETNVVLSHQVESKTSTLLEEELWWIFEAKKGFDVGGANIPQPTQRPSQPFQSTQPITHSKHCKHTWNPFPSLPFKALYRGHLHDQANCKRALT